MGKKNNQKKKIFGQTVHNNLTYLEATTHTIQTYGRYCPCVQRSGILPVIFHRPLKKIITTTWPFLAICLCLQDLWSDRPLLTLESFRPHEAQGWRIGGLKRFRLPHRLVQFADKVLEVFQASLPDLPEVFPEGNLKLLFQVGVLGHQHLHHHAEGLAVLPVHLGEGRGDDGAG